MMAGVQDTSPEDPNPLALQAAEEGPALQPTSLDSHAVKST